MVLLSFYLRDPKKEINQRGDEDRAAGCRLHTSLRGGERIKSATTTKRSSKINELVRLRSRLLVGKGYALR
jgi:hypothetical protein